MELRILRRLCPLLLQGFNLAVIAGNLIVNPLQLQLGLGNLSLYLIGIILKQRCSHLHHITLCHQQLLHRFLRILLHIPGFLGLNGSGIPVLYTAVGSIDGCHGFHIHLIPIACGTDSPPQQEKCPHCHSSCKNHNYCNNNSHLFLTHSAICLLPGYHPVIKNGCKPISSVYNHLIIYSPKMCPVIS